MGPPVVRRALWRVVVGVLVALAVVGVAGGLWARGRVGANANDTRQRIERDTQARLTRLSGALDRAAQDLAGAGTMVEAASSGDAASLGRLFTAVSVDAVPDRREVVALTVYGPEGTPLAWDGRPSTVPASRLAGPAATFLLPAPQGLRLARLVPMAADDDGRRRLGVVVAEAAVADAGAAMIGGWESDLAPVVLAPSLSAGPPGSFEVRASDGVVLGTATIPPEGVARAREATWQRVAVWLWGTGAIGAALFWAPLTMWRRLARSTTEFLGTSAGLAASTVIALAMVDRALALATPTGARDWRAVAVAGAGLVLVSLAAVALGRARVTDWLGPARRSRSWQRTAVALALAGGVLGLVGAWHGRVLVALTAGGGSAVDITLTPLETGHAVSALAFVLAHAAGALLVITLARALIAVIGGRPWWARAWPSVILVAGVASLTALLAAVEPSTPAAALAVAIVLVMMTTAADHATRTLRRGSQPARLLVLLAALVTPALGAYPSLVRVVGERQRDVVVREVAAQVAEQRQAVQAALRQALDEIWTAPDIADLVRTAPVSAAPPPDAAFLLWSRTALATRRLTSSVELYDRGGRLVSRFALNLPEVAVDQGWQEAGCDWELFEEVSPFFAEERRLLHAGRGVCEHGVVVGSLVVHVVLDYANLPFLAAQQPYVAVLGGVQDRETRPRDDIAFAVYGWSRRPLFSSGGEAWTLPEALLTRLVASREPFWTTLDRQGVTSDVYFTSDRGAIYAIGSPRPSRLAHLSNLAELVALTAILFVVLLAIVSLGSRLGGAVAVSGRALFRDVRASFSRTLFLAFVAAVVVPVVALALVTRAYMATTLRQDIEREATRTVLSASRVVADFAAIEARGATNLPALDDSLLVWLSRVIGEDLNVYAGPGLLASSERNLFASGLLATRTPGDTYRALVIDGQPTYLARETVAGYEYQVASALVRVADQQAIVSVPLTLRQQSIERQIDELDRRVLLAAIAFILLGSAIGYWAAERISDPVSRLTRATRRLAAGDLDAHVLVRTSDELGRLVAAFNGMADDLRRQRTALERTNRLEAWAEMARQVAHDIKNPLTPVQLNAEHLRRVHLDRGRPLGAVVDDCVSNILLQVRLLRQLASEFSSFASAPQARPAMTPLQPLLDEILSPYAQALAGRIAIVVGADDAPAVYVDRVLLARALTNVIENALHAMPGPGTLTVAATTTGDGRARIDVVDTGVGMDEAALARIFEPYFSTKATGTGLGLTIARRNVELNGGTIAVTSAPGVGTTVSLWVPLAAPEAPAPDATVPGAAAR